jgi:hypothetical protein
MWQNKRQKHIGNIDVTDVVVSFLISLWQHKQLHSSSARFEKGEAEEDLYMGLQPEREMAVRKRDELDSLT